MMLPYEDINSHVSPGSKGLDALKEELSRPRRIAITTHSKPDGDAMGSGLAMYHYLKALGHQVSFVLPSDYGHYLAWMPGVENVLTYTHHRDAVHQALNSAELMFCLDFSAYGRVEYMESALRKVHVPLIMIDHHLHPESWAAYSLWNSQAAATAELVYYFIRYISPDFTLTPEIAICIYTGIMTDTGSFRFGSVRPAVHRVVAELLETGMDHTQVHERINDTFTGHRLQFFGHCLKEKLVVMPEYHAAYIYVSREELMKYGISTGDTEGLVQYPMSIEGVRFGALIVEREGVVKISLRSKGNFSARDIAERYFQGGGHFNAAGGRYKPDLAEAVQVFIRSVEESANLLREE